MCRRTLDNDLATPSLPPFPLLSTGSLVTLGKAIALLYDVREKPYIRPKKSGHARRAGMSPIFHVQYRMLSRSIHDETSSNHKIWLLTAEPRETDLY